MKKDAWTISNPTFESDRLNPQLKFAYWEGHRNFIYDFLSFVKPERIVELGSQYGCSLFAMAQSIKDYQLKSEINAIDFWKGDIGAPDRGEKIFSLVNDTVQKYYANIQINLFQMGFDEARPKFQDESIDIIHIDGGHRFEDVDHDFRLWMPTLRKNGIILFHDTYSTIDQGSCDHWKYIKEHYDVWFDFPHSCGLGVLFPKGDYWYRKLNEVGFFPYIRETYLYKAKANYVQERFDELAALYEKRYQSIEQQSEMIDERDKTIASQGKLLAERYTAIQEQTEMIENRDKEIKAQKKLVEERYSAIQKQSRMIQERDKEIEAQRAMVEERYSAIQNQSKMIDERDETIRNQEIKIENMDMLLRDKQNQIEQRDKKIQEKELELTRISSELDYLQTHYWKIKKPLVK